MGNGDQLPQHGLYHPSFEGFLRCRIHRQHKGRKSHQTVKDGLTMLERMAHRSACGCRKPNTGRWRWHFDTSAARVFVNECRKLNIKLPAYGNYGVGLVFFPADAKVREECRTVLNRQIKRWKCHCWDTDPCQPAMMTWGNSQTNRACDGTSVHRAASHDWWTRCFERKLFYPQKIFSAHHHGVGCRRQQSILFLFAVI